MSDSIDPKQAEWDIWEPVRARGDTYLCKRLLANRRPVNIRGGQYNRTLLHVAAEKGYVEVCQLMLKYGAKVDAVDKIGDTPIAPAALNGHVEHAVRAFPFLGMRVREANT